MDQQKNKSYGLLNKRLNRKLTHPKVGLWFTNNIEEAEDMLKACKEYLAAIGAEALSDDFEIVELSLEGSID